MVDDVLVVWSKIGSQWDTIVKQIDMTLLSFFQLEDGCSMIDDRF